MVYLVLVVLMGTNAFGKTVSVKELRSAKDLEGVDVVQVPMGCEVEEIPFSDPNFVVEMVAQPRFYNRHLGNLQSFKGTLNNIIYEWNIALGKGTTATEEMGREVANIVRKSAGHCRITAELKLKSSSDCAATTENPSNQ